jgi:hypothetical protein
MPVTRYPPLILVHDGTHEEAERPSSDCETWRTQSMHRPHRTQGAGTTIASTIDPRLSKLPLNGLQLDYDIRVSLISNAATRYEGQSSKAVGTHGTGGSPKPRVLLTPCPPSCSAIPHNINRINATACRGSILRVH